MKEKKEGIPLKSILTDDRNLKVFLMEDPIHCDPKLRNSIVNIVVDKASSASKSEDVHREHSKQGGQESAKNRKNKNKGRNLKIIDEAKKLKGIGKHDHEISGCLAKHGGDGWPTTPKQIRDILRAGGFFEKKGK